MQAYAQHFYAKKTSAPAYSFASNRHERRGMGDTLERHPFSGLVHSVGELLHTP